MNIFLVLFDLKVKGEFICCSLVCTEPSYLYEFNLKFCGIAGIGILGQTEFGLL